ncbi:uclacyanin-3-like [Euphorbia lathyris]|uniref:uclacyanin-3-like n=1 Tax=Euphorbia lathyris TaxID=212925 RepID=UPI003313CDF9
MGVSIGLVVLFLFAVPAAYAAQHTVGGSSGWTNFGVNYDTWAAGETFTVGDTLLFSYSGTHSVAEVPETGYSGCSSSNAVQTYNDGSTTISLTKPGPMYFICSTSGHCGSGMKMQINVVAASTPTPATPSTPTPSTPATPGTTTPSEAGTPPTTTPAPKTPSTPADNGGGANVVSKLILGSLLVLGIMGLAS